MLRQRRNIRLPPLLIDGEPKSFIGMGTRDLQLCLTLALKASYELPLTTSAFRYRSYTRPDWWPDDLDWSNHYIDDILPVEDRSKYVRDLLRLCYRHYHQEETLFLFDANPGELPQWQIIHDSDSWKLASLETGAEIWRFPSSYQVTSLCALEARLIEEHRLLSAKSSLLRFSPKKAMITPTATRSRLLDNHFTTEVSPCERRLFDTKSRATSLETVFVGKHDGPIIKATPVECRDCKQKFARDVDLASHLITCSATTRHQMEKNSQLFRFGLVPKVVNAALSAERSERKLMCERKIRRFGGSFRGEITSELGRLLLATEGVDRKSASQALKADRNCIGAVLPNGRRARQAANAAGNGYVQNVYRRIPGLKNNNILLKFNGAERRFAVRQRVEMKRKVKQWCVPLRVVLQRLTGAELAKYVIVGPSPEFAGVKNLRVVVERLSAEDEAAMLAGKDSPRADDCQRAKMMRTSVKSEKRSEMLTVIAQEGPCSTPSPRNHHPSSSRTPTWKSGGAMETSKALRSNMPTLTKADITNAKRFLKERTSLPLFPSHKLHHSAALVTPLNHSRGSLRRHESPTSPSPIKTDQSTLFFCRLCGFERLFEEKARGSIQHHVALHDDLPIVYKRLHHTIAGVRLLVVEAVRDECIGAINRK